MLVSVSAMRLLLLGTMTLVAMTSQVHAQTGSPRGLGAQAQKMIMIPGEGTLVIGKEPAGDATFYPGLLPKQQSDIRDVCRLCSCCFHDLMPYEQLMEKVLNQKEPALGKRGTEIPGFYWDPLISESYGARPSAGGVVRKWTGKKSLYEIDMKEFLKHFRE